MTDYVDRNVQRLLHMIVGIERIKRSLAGISQEAFLADEMRQSSVAFDISTIGESAANVTEEFRRAHPEIPWEKMRGMRNRLVHIFDYGQIDYEIVWDVAVNALPSLEPALRVALATIPLPDDFRLPDM